MRSGSSRSCLRVEPLGQMNPWLNTSSRSPRMRMTSSPRRLISRPHPASQSGHVRMAVRVSTSERSVIGDMLPPVRQLFPNPIDDVDVAAAYTSDERLRSPWLLVNMISTVDGATAIAGKSGGLGGPADKRVFAAIRSLADFILVGAGTVRAENYGPPPAGARLVIVS